MAAREAHTMAKVSNSACVTMKVRQITPAILRQSSSEHRDGREAKHLDLSSGAQGFRRACLIVKKPPPLLAVARFWDREKQGTASREPRDASQEKEEEIHVQSGVNEVEDGRMKLGIRATAATSFRATRTTLFRAATTTLLEAAATMPFGEKPMSSPALGAATVGHRTFWKGLNVLGAVASELERVVVSGVAGSSPSPSSPPDPSFSAR